MLANLGSERSKNKTLLQIVRNMFSTITRKPCRLYRKVSDVELLSAIIISFSISQSTITCPQSTARSLYSTAVRSEALHITALPTTSLSQKARSLEITIWLSDAQYDCALFVADAGWHAFQLPGT